MIRYCPPKSAVWGHQVGRLSAAEVADKAAAFVERNCIVLSEAPGAVLLVWEEAPHLSALPEDMEQALGAADFVRTLDGPTGRPVRQCRWTCAAKDLRKAAAWLDQLREYPAESVLVAQANVSWTFAWREETPPLRPLESAGGIFGVYLARPNRVTTMFTFQDMGQYSRISTELATLGLATLSDRHLRPRPRAT